MAADDAKISSAFPKRDRILQRQILGLENCRNKSLARLCITRYGAGLGLPILVWSGFGGIRLHERLPTKM